MCPTHSEICLDRPVEEAVIVRAGLDVEPQFLVVYFACCMPSILSLLLLTILDCFFAP